MDDSFSIEEFQEFLKQSADKSEETAKALYQKLASELTNRPLDFYLYLIPAAIIPVFTSFLPPAAKAYTDIVLITVYVSAVYETAR